MIPPVRTVAPAAVIDVEEARRHLRVDHHDDDLLIASLVAAATAHLDGWAGILGRALGTQTWRVDLPDFCDRMRLPLVPVASVTSVKYSDTANVEQTVSSSIYRLTADAIGSFVERVSGQSWPAVYDRPDAVRITFVAGEATVPAPIKAAILLMVGDLYANRETVAAANVAAVPMSATVDALLAPYRRITL